MTQSKKDDSFTIDVSGLKFDDVYDTTGDITINLNDTYGATTTYWAGDSISDITISGASNGTFTIGATDTINIENWSLSVDGIYPNEIERMCEHYPGLEKVWRNFKSVYDMCKQDFEGKKKAGEIDDDIPF